MLGCPGSSGLLDSPRVSGGTTVKQLRLFVAVAYLLAATGCSHFVQVPPSDFAAQDVRKDVVVRTDSGQQYSFDRVTVEPDTLKGTGYRVRTLLLGNGETTTEEIA